MSPLNVLPNMTKPPDGIAGTEVQVGQPAPPPAVSPLGGEHDEVEGVTRLDLEPADAAATGVVDRVERLHDDALVAEGDCLVEERARFGRVRRHLPWHTQLFGHHRRQCREALAAGETQQLVVVEAQHVEEERRHRCGRPGLCDIDARGRAAAGLLERSRPAVLVQRDGLSVEHDRAHRQGKHVVDDLGQPLGDVVEAAGEDADVVAVAVHLHADAVELPLDGRRAHAAERVVDVDGGGGQHRLHRLSDDQPKRCQPVDTRGQGCFGDRAERPAHHGCAAYVGQRHAGGARNRVDHHSLERTLSQLAAEQTAQQVLLGLGRPAEQLADQPRALRLRPGSRQRGDGRASSASTSMTVSDARLRGAGTRATRPSPRRCAVAGRSPER